MNVEARIYKNESGNIVAAVSLVFDGVFIVKGYKVMRGPKGLFVSPPQRLKAGTTKEWIDQAHPITGDFKKHLDDVIMRAYNIFVGNTADGQQQPPPEHHHNDDLPF